MPVVASFEIHGIADMVNRLRMLSHNLPGRAAAALYSEAEAIMTRAKDEFVPVDLGTLRASGMVDPPVIEGATISVRLSFGGAAAAYALAVHEYPSGHNPPSWDKAAEVTFHPEGRGPKYLEIPLREAAEDMAGRLAQKLNLDRAAQMGED